MKPLFKIAAVLFLSVLILSCSSSAALRGGYGCGLQLCPVCNHDCYYNTHTGQTMGEASYEKWRCSYCELIRWVVK